MEANNTANNGKKNIVNTTVVRGFVATEPKVSNFAETSVIRFALAVRNRTTKKATGEVTSQSSLITVEKWAKNTNLSSFNAISSLMSGLEMTAFTVTVSSSAHVQSKRLPGLHCSLIPQPLQLPDIFSLHNSRCSNRCEHRDKSRQR